jgi:hypothetical protein
MVRQGCSGRPASPFRKARVRISHPAAD